MPDPKESGWTTDDDGNEVHEVMQTVRVHMSHQWPEVHRYSMFKLQTCSNQPSEEEPTQMMVTVTES